MQTTVVPVKRARYDGSANMGIAPTPTTHANTHQIFQQNYQEHAKGLQTPSSPTNSNSTTSLYQGLPAAHESHPGRSDVTGLVLGSKLGLGLLLPNPAPDVTPVVNDPAPVNNTARKLTVTMHTDSSSGAGPQKKKYAKEAWPGRKPMLGSL